jgi:type 1 glutamine amidotransferase
MAAAELPAWAAGTIPKAATYERDKADAEYTAKVQPNLPTQALVAPAKPRRVLLFHNPRNYRHTAEVLLRKAIPEMGSKTGAFAVTVTDDPGVFTAAGLAAYDAVFFCNVNNVEQVGSPDLAGCQAVLDYVAGGGGWVGNHASVVALGHHKEFAAMVGGLFMWHPWECTEVMLRNEAPQSPFTAAFGSEPFPYADEIFTHSSPPFSREKQTVLLSIDWERSTKAQAIAADLRAKNKARALRDDNDYAVSWIKPHGKGRVFYTTLGHAHTTLADPRFLSHMLAAVQYAVGDLVPDSGR